MIVPAAKRNIFINHIIFAQLFGEMAERSNAAVSSEWIPSGKTVVLARVNQNNLCMSFYVYILKSYTHNRRYIGSCANLEIRLNKHNSGKVISSKPYRPYKIIYTEEFETRREAVQRERFFKTIDGYNFLKGTGIYDK